MLMLQSIVDGANIYNVFLEKSLTDQFWGGDKHLSALTQALGIQIFVLTQQRGTFGYQPKTRQPEKTIYVWYNGGTHYKIIWNKKLHRRQAAKKTPQKNMLPGKPLLKPPSISKSVSNVIPDARKGKRVSFGTLVLEKTMTTGKSMMHINPRLQSPPNSNTPSSSTISSIRKIQDQNPTSPKNSTPLKDPNFVFP
jgi:hypothetical protein